VERSAAQALPDVGRPTSGRAADLGGRIGVCHYAPLTDWLNRHLGPWDREISLRFAEIEQIIDAKLPASARARRSFWANDITHSHAKSWLSAGFETTSLSLKNEVVTFRFSRRVPRPHGPDARFGPMTSLTATPSPGSPRDSRQPRCLSRTKWSHSASAAGSSR